MAVLRGIPLPSRYLSQCVCWWARCLLLSCVPPLQKLSRLLPKSTLTEMAEVLEHRLFDTWDTASGQGGSDGRTSTSTHFVAAEQSYLVCPDARIQTVWIQLRRSLPSRQSDCEKETPQCWVEGSKTGKVRRPLVQTTDDDLRNWRADLLWRPIAFLSMSAPCTTLPVNCYVTAGHKIATTTATFNSYRGISIYRFAFEIVALLHFLTSSGCHTRGPQQPSVPTAMARSPRSVKSSG